MDGARARPSRYKRPNVERDSHAAAAQRVQIVGPDEAGLVSKSAS
jgi:hypothetical protein